MRILAIDTTTDSCSTALWNNGNYWAYFETSTHEHSKLILPLVKKILHKGDIVLTNLDAIAFSHGPGSFTGVRICINIAQGLSIGANLPLIGISTLATMAQGAFRKIGATRVLVALDARMGEIYWAQYTRDKNGVWHGKETEAVYKLEIINKWLKTISSNWVMVGKGWQTWPKIVKVSYLTLVDGNTYLLPAAVDMLPIARQMLIAGKIITAEQAEPVYIRNAVIQKY